MVDRRVDHLPLPGAAPAVKKGGGAPSTSSPSRVAPHYALPQRIRRIRANPLPMRIPGHSLDHNGEGFAL